MRSIYFALLGGLALSASACTNDSNNLDTPERTDYDAVAQSVATTHAPADGGGDTGSMADVIDLSTGIVPVGFTVGASGMITGAHFGLDYAYQLTCSDATGTVLSACGTLTDSVMANVSWSGTLTLPILSAMVSRTGMWNITGIQSGTATVAGNGTFTFDSTLTASGQTRAWHLAYTSDYNDVQVQRQPEAVTGGSIHDTIDASRMVSGSTTQVDARFHIDAVLTFHPDGTAQLVLDGDQYYTIAADGTISHS